MPLNCVFLSYFGGNTWTDCDPLTLIACTINGTGKLNVYGNAARAGLAYQSFLWGDYFMVAQ